MQKDIIKNYSPVVGSGEYVCEHEKCRVLQTNESVGDILYYGSDNKMYCGLHIALHIKLEKKLNCPLCLQSELVYEVRKTTHVWKCEGCPCLVIEFYGDEDIINLIKK